MRFIDRWVGIPLTFLLSLALIPFNWLRGNRMNASRALFIELSEMGSAILADPAIRRLRDECNAELFFVIFEKNAPSLQILNTIEDSNIFRMRSDNLRVMLLDVVRFLFWCRKNQITCVIDLELFSRFTALLSGLSGAGMRVGFTNYHDEGLYRGRIINRSVRYNPHTHISKNFIALVNACLGYHDSEYATHPIEHVELAQASISHESREEVRQVIHQLYSEFDDHRIIVFNMNASDLLPQRRWMPDRFAQLAINMLNEYDDILIVATGSPAEFDYVQQISEMVGHPRFVNSAGRFKFLELIPLYDLSTLMLTNDSGPAHFASVTGLKTFVIFGPETPSLYLPLGNSEAIYLNLPCSPCVSAANHRKTSCVTRPCITGISTQMVQHRITKYLEETSPAHLIMA